MKNKIFLLYGLFVLSMAQAASGQEIFSLSECLDYALENNLSLQKDKLAIETAYQSKREVVGALLPQVSGSAGFTDNIQKTKIVMPNFVNDMLPEAMRDPNASKYMSVTMGTDLNANWGFSLSQQILNFSLFNAVSIAKTAEDMAVTGVEISRKDVMAETATLYYNVQVLEYTIEQFGESIALLDKTKRMMEACLDNGIVRKIDADQIQVSKINLETEKMNLELALEVQRKLLKLQMGYDMNSELLLEKLNINELEEQIYMEDLNSFNAYEQLPYKLVKKQQDMLNYQKKAAISETLPTLVFTGQYSHNYLGDDFHGETYQHFPVSMLMLNLKVPIFTGMSKNAKIKKAEIELQKAERDETQIVQSLNMGYSNARRQLDQSRLMVETQRRNKELAEEVMAVTESNYGEGLSSLSDMLNANSSFIQAELNYVNALNNCITAYIDLKRVEGTIQDINK